MQLALRRARADRAPRDQVGYELWRNCVEKLDADRYTHVREVAKELASNPQTFVDLEGAVDIGVVNEAFPADRRPRFLSYARRKR